MYQMKCDCCNKTINISDRVYFLIEGKETLQSCSNKCILILKNKKIKRLKEQISLLEEEKNKKNISECVSKVKEYKINDLMDRLDKLESLDIKIL